MRIQKIRISKTVKIVLILMLFSNNFLYAQKTNKPVAKNGILDLTNWNFEKEGKINLSGEWEFYWNKFYNYNDFQKDNLKPDIIVKVPSTWNTYKINGEKLPAFGAATYRLTLKTDTALKEITIYCPNQATAYQLFFNDNSIIKSGNQSLDKENQISSRHREIVTLQLDTNVNQLIFQVSNYNYTKGGLWLATTVGTKKEINNSQEGLLFSDVFLVGILFLISIFSFSLFFFRRNDKASLFFALFNFAFLIRILFTNALIVEHFFNGFPYTIALKIEYITLAIFPLFFLLFFENLFQKTRIKFLSYLFSISLSIYVVLILFTSDYFYTSILRPFQAILLLQVIYGIILIVRAIKKKYLSAKIILIGFIFIFIATFIDILESNQFFYLEFKTGPISVVIFIIMQLIALVFHILGVERDKTNLERNLKTINQLNEIGLDVIANLEIENILNTVYQKLKIIVKFDNLAIGIYNKEKNSLQFFGKTDKNNIETGEDALNENISLSGRCFTNDETFFISEYSTEYKKYFSEFVFYRDTDHYESLIYIPLKVKDKKIGVLTIQDKNKNAFSEFDLKTVQNIALFASVAFDNANAYQTINANEQKLSVIFETANEGIGLVDTKGNFTFANNSLSKILGYTPEELIKINYFKLIPETNNDNFKKLVSGEIEFISIENQYIRKDGTKVWGKLSAKCIKNEKNEIESVVGIITDIENIKQNELRIKNASRKVTSSINYASKIQQALLPANERINELFPQNFILYKPRDIVSGDFYFTKKIKNYLVLAVADCTGHGVPGAMMSMLGISFLNEIVRQKNVKNSAQILEQLRENIKSSLKQTGGKNEQQDGMDITVIVYDTESNTIDFAGANSPILILRNKKLIEIKGDRMPVGIYHKERPFTNHEIKIKPNDTLYFFSDGYHSQLGGKRYEKFKTKKFKELLSNICELPMDEQKIILENNFNQWKGRYEQTDDVLVVGIKINL